MTRQIKINEDRTVYIEGNLYSGVEGENNFELLTFTFPASLEDFNKSLIIETNNGSFVKEIKNNQYVMESEELTGEEIILQVIFKKGNNIIGKSAPFTLLLYNSIDDSGINAITLAHSEQRESDRAELAESLKQQDINNGNNPDDYTSKTWSELKDAIENITYRSTEDDNIISDYNTLKNIYALESHIPSVLSSDNGISQYYSVPFIQTSKWLPNGYEYISQYITECGFDCSSFSANSLGNNSPSTNSIFKYATHLEKIKLTNLQNCTTFFRLFSFNDYLKLKEIELDNVEGTKMQANAYRDMFAGCPYLETVAGYAFDFTNTSTAEGMLNNCESLKNIKFLPNTLKTNINIAKSSQLTPESILSIINSVISGSGITININANVKTKMSYLYATFDSDSNIWIACSQSDNGALTYDNILTLSVIAGCKGAILA
jgi:hypothetical protein